MVGDGTAYSEGAAYGSDQSQSNYSPYSVYSEANDSSLYKPGAPEYIARKKAVLAESQKRVSKLPGYIEKKKPAAPDAPDGTSTKKWAKMLGFM